MNNFILVFLVCLFLLNVYVTLKVVRSNHFDSFQKKAQVALIWLIPFISSIGMMLILKSFNESSKPKGSFGGGPSANFHIGASGD